MTKHVHGTRVWVVGDPAPDPPEFDVLVGDRRGDVLGAFAADCIPILFCDPRRRVVAAAHAGWRGTVAGAAANAVHAMADRFGSSAEDIRVALGPSIGPCCFEVGPEVVDAFRAALPPIARPRRRRAEEGSHRSCASPPALSSSASASGLEHIDDRPPCTRCDAERFFSFRRDGLEGGVHMGFIGVR